MLIDWFTVGAQALNFLILVWLMKRFLYQPILHAIDAREKRIAAELADADAKRTEAEQERARFEKKNEEFDRQRAGVLRQVADEAEAERGRLLGEGRQAAETWRAKRQEALRSEARSLTEAISRRAGAEVFAIARKTLTDLAGTTLEERMSEMFTRRLRALRDAAKQGLVPALSASSAPAIVRSAYELSSEQRAAIRQALDECVSHEVDVQFEIAPELVSGIELTSNGQKVAWSISDYLGSLEKGVRELLDEQVRSEASVERKTEPKADASQ
jgi:F-type H+-transporting ATPase subunit b